MTETPKGPPPPAAAARRRTPDDMLREAIHLVEKHCGVTNFFGLPRACQAIYMPLLVELIRVQSLPEFSTIREPKK